MKLSEQNPELYVSSGLRDIHGTFLALTARERRRIIEYPPFRIWLQHALALVSSPKDQSDADWTETREILAKLGRVIDTCLRNEEGQSRPWVDGTPVAVARFAVDPLIAGAVPPSYRFPEENKQQELENSTIYSLPFFLEVASAAFEQIRQTWPEAYRDFTRLVRLIIHLPDATFRSCSADRYTGVILLSASDTTLLEVEESLIHEYGHQILYNVMELDPLVLNQSGRVFYLPWSGSERDLYGYFHAFYIYLLLALYFERIRGRPAEEMERASARFTQILRGLVVAVPDLEGANEFTAKGSNLFGRLKTEINRLERQYGHLLSEAEKP